MRALRTALAEVVGLVVEDGYVAVGAVLALLATYGMTREAVFGPRQQVGWALLVLSALALLGSVRRAARAHVWSEHLDDVGGPHEQQL